MFAWRSLPTRAGARAGAYVTVPDLARAGIRVAFTTRLGGYSEGPWSSLNLSFVSEDDPAVVRRNRERALEAVGLSIAAWTSGRQVHGTHVASVDEGGRGATDPLTTIPDTDALLITEPGPGVAVLVADCMPILLADVARRRVAVVHAGWRGLVGGVIRNAVDALENPADLCAYVGPSIGPCCYEVGDDVAAPARAALGEAVVREAPIKPHLDLWRGATIALRAAGVMRIYPSMLCTRCEPHRFYSHRAGDTGRQGVLATIEPR